MASCSPSNECDRCRQGSRSVWTSSCPRNARLARTAAWAVLHPVILPSPGITAIEMTIWMSRSLAGATPLATRRSVLLLQAVPTVPSG